MKLVVTDVDGCISPEESIPWDLDLFCRLARHSQEASAGRGSAAPLTLCTGRPQPYAEVLMKLLDVRAPAICENGAVLYTLHDNRSRYGPGVTEEKVLGLRRVRAYIETEILPAEPDAVLQSGKEAQISVYSERPEILPPIRERIVRFVADNAGPALSMNTTYYYLNISLDGVDKGKALQVVFDELGLARGDVAGIGDTEGDLPLRDAVGFFACPANARPAVKDVADYVSPYPTLQGVLDILQRPELRRDGV